MYYSFYLLANEFTISKLSEVQKAKVKNSMSPETIEGLEDDKSKADGKKGEKFLFEMLRSFVTLAETLNLSQAVEILGSTRQTMRRHLDILQQARGGPLFELVHRQYQLTELGRQSVKEAEIILARGGAWLKGRNHHIDGLEMVKLEGKDGQMFQYQQHHLSRLWSDGTPLLQKGFNCWAASREGIEDQAFKELRPYMLVYRPLGNNWQCVEIGERSVYSFWFGWKTARSSVGRNVRDRLLSAAFSGSILHSYQKVYDAGTIRLDHLSRFGPRKEDGEMLPSHYQRLLIGSSFPDGDFALIVLTDLTDNVEIRGVNASPIASMSKEILAEFKEFKEKEHH